jgi:peroxiredoxin
VGAWFYKAYKMPPKLDTKISELVGENGSPANISDYRGKYVLVSYFQTWCGECIQELQSMNALQAKVGKNRIQIMLISDEPLEKIKRFKEKYCKTLDYYQSAKTLKDQNIRVFPTTFLLDPNGNVLLSKINSFEWDNTEVLRMIK